MRKPDLIIGDPPQTLRWHLFRRWGVQVALHRWLRSDNDRALHDHSAGNISILLTGCYTEVIGYFFTCDHGEGWGYTRHLRLPFVPYYRRADTPHRIELTHGPVWTLWIRFKPWREWGFWCPKGWRHWKDFVANSQREGGIQSNVGRGCD